MNQGEVFDVLERTGAVITDSHVVYRSRLHGSSYVNKDAVYPYTYQISRLCEEIADQFASNAIEAVVGPATGGIVLSQWVAHHLLELTGLQALALHADKWGGGFSLMSRGYKDLISRKRVLVVEDVLTTGGSARSVIHAVKEALGEVVGLGVLCNRGGLTATSMNVPRLHSLIDIRLETWDAQVCPLCNKGVPINTTVGYGKQFLKEHESRISA